MSDLNHSVVSSSEAQTKSIVLVIYGLYLVAIVSCGAAGIAGIAGVVLAYVKRGDVMAGSLWSTHLENQISSFWIWLILMIVGGATWWMIGLGFLLMGFALIYFLYRTLKGLIRALDYRPF